VVFKNIRQSGVNLVWIHQIGNVFSTILVLLLRSTGKPVIWTLHDFSFLNKNKLYPKDIGFQSKLYSLHSGGSNEFDSPKIKLRVSNWRIFLRSLYFRIISIGTILVPISGMQKVILESFGFKTSVPIGNGVDKCTCINQSYRDTKAILFAGRLIGKGLSHLIQIIKNSNSLRLVLAGDEFLLEQAREELSDRQFEYHGRCSSDQVAALIHKVGFVAVLSDCFDVYPSILLESVSHGAFPITYPSVGNSQIALQIHPRLLLPYGEHLGEHELEEILKDRQGGELMELDSFAKMCSQYSQLIDLLLKR
jgi:hypothetical protein